PQPAALVGAPTVIEIQAGSFASSLNIEVGVLAYGDDVIHNAPPYTAQPNMAQYHVPLHFTGAAEAVYRLEVLYAGEESGPVQVSVNGAVVSPDALTATTGGWYPADQRWGSVGEVSLVDGVNVLRISRDSYFPSIRKLRLTLVG